MPEADVLAIVKLRLGFDGQWDELIGSYVSEIGDRIRHYCNISDIPTALERVWASMAIDLLRIEQPKLPEIEESSGEAESITIGDTSTAPAQAKGVTNVSKSIIDELVLNYRADLNRYRRLRW